MIIPKIFIGCYLHRVTYGLTRPEAWVKWTNFQVWKIKMLEILNLCEEKTFLVADLIKGCVCVEGFISVNVSELM